MSKTALLSGISHEAFLAMLEQQNQTQIETIGSGWKLQRIPFHLAVNEELVELCNHLGWYWWRKTNPDLAQAKMEVVDIFLFMVSAILQHPDQESIADADWFLQLQTRLYMPPENFQPTAVAVHAEGIKLVEMLTGQWHFKSVVYSCQFVNQFQYILQYMGMGWAELERLFWGKSALHRLRQANGYKDGTYVKRWAIDWETVVEDNVVMTRIAERVGPDLHGRDIYEVILRDLAKAYSLVTCSPANI